MSETYLKIIVNKYYDPSSKQFDNDGSVKVVSTNIEFNDKDYYVYDYETEANLTHFNYISLQEQQNDLSYDCLAQEVLCFKMDGNILQNHYCRNINLNEKLIKDKDFLAKIKSVCELNNLKYMILTPNTETNSSSSVLAMSDSRSKINDIWIDKDFAADLKSETDLVHNTIDGENPFVDYTQLKVLGLQSDLETSFPLLLKLRSQHNTPNIHIKKLELESFKLLPLVFGYKKGDLISLCDYYKVDVLYPNLLCNIETFAGGKKTERTIYILSKNSQTDVMIVYSIFKKKLDSLKKPDSSVIVKNLNNLNNSYINFEMKLLFFHNDMKFLSLLNSLMFEFSCFIELNLKLKQIFIIGDYEVFILNLLKILHLKVYNKVYEFRIAFKNDHNYNAFKNMILTNEPHLMLIASTEEDRNGKIIHLIGDKWEKFIGLYINLNQENLNYTFYLELSNEFKEFIIGKKFGKINKIEKQCNMKCKISILINNEKNKRNKEFITLELKSDSFIEVINCLKLIQYELPYEKKLYIPEAFHKFIIGVNGENIQSIMKRYNCFIQFLNTFDIRQNEYSFIRHSNVVIRCPLKNYNNVKKVVKELHSLSMEIFNLSKIQTKEANGNDLSSLKLLKLKNRELDLMVFSDTPHKLHKVIGELEMKYNLFIRFPEFDEKKSLEEELFIILKSCKHNNVLKLEAGEGNMNILKMKNTMDKTGLSNDEEDHNLKLCFAELIESYIPRKDVSCSSTSNLNEFLSVEKFTEDVQKMMLWRFSLLVLADKGDKGKPTVYKL